MKIGFWEVTENEKKNYFTNELSGPTLTFFEDVLTEDCLPEERDFDVIAVFVCSKISEKVINSFPNLKYIVTCSTGFDHIDTAAAKQKNISVSNVPAYGSNTVAEFAFGLILSLSRKIPQAVTRLKTAEEFTLLGLRGFDLNGKTLGVIGTGKIGINVIKIAKGFNMQILAHDPHPRTDADFKYVSLPELLQNSDIVTIHVPLCKETEYLINKEKISLMKKGSLLINTSRGRLVDTDALFAALTSKHLAGAALDVLEEEVELKEEAELLGQGKMNSKEYKTILENHILIHLPNVIITPHMAFYSKEAEFSIMETTVSNIKSAISGTPENLVGS